MSHDLGRKNSVRIFPNGGSIFQNGVSVFPIGGVYWSNSQENLPEKVHSRWCSYKSSANRWLVATDNGLFSNRLDVKVALVAHLFALYYARTREKSQIFCNCYVIA
jgi:hypothetical protein